MLICYIDLGDTLYTLYGSPLEFCVASMSKTHKNPFSSKNTLYKKGHVP